MKICNKLWKANIPAEFGYKADPKLKPQLSYAEQEGIPFVILFGEQEAANQQVKVSLRCCDAIHCQFMRVQQR